MANVSYRLGHSGSEIDEILDRAAPSGSVQGTIDYHIGELYRSISSVNTVLSNRIAAVETTAQTNAENTAGTATALSNVNSRFSTDVAALQARVTALEEANGSVTYDGVSVKQMTMFSVDLSAIAADSPTVITTGLNDVSRLALYSATIASGTWTSGGYTGTRTVMEAGSSIPIEPDSPRTIYSAKIRFDRGSGSETRSAEVWVMLSGTNLVFYPADWYYVNEEVKPRGELIFYAINDF